MNKNREYFLNKFLRFVKSKNIGEIGLMLTIVFLAIVSIIYANRLADSIQKQEEAQVILWAKAIGEKAKILKLSNEIFLKLAEEERKKGTRAVYSLQGHQ